MFVLFDVYCFKVVWIFVFFGSGGEEEAETARFCSRTPVLDTSFAVWNGFFGVVALFFQFFSLDKLYIEFTRGYK